MPVAEIGVLGGVLRVASADILELLVVNGVDMDGKVVLASENTVAIGLWAREFGHMGRIGVNGLAMRFEREVVLELLATLRTDGRVTFERVGEELFGRSK
jgi:hypothetical protein